MNWKVEEMEIVFILREQYEHFENQYQRKKLYDGLKQN